MRQSNLSLILLFTFLLGIAVVGFWVADKKASTPQDNEGQKVSTSKIGGSFSLVDHNGRAVTQKDYADKYKLMFFGFTHCPGICPGELQKMSEVLDILAEDGLDKKIYPLFITIDPERDDVPAMKEYVEAFDPRIIGLTGTAQQIEDIKAAYKVYAKKVENAMMGEGNYMMDHSTTTYLMSPENDLLLMFPMKDKPQTIAEEIKSALK